MDKKIKLSLRDCVKEYKTGGESLRILDGINLDIYENEFVTLLGESGCGKTTLLNIIGGMDEMTSGTLTVEGGEVSLQSEKAITQYRRNYIGYIFQECHLMPNLTALENIEIIASLKEDSGDSREALRLVGLEERANHFPSQLSLGQRQRVAIARALVKKPGLVIADEPTASLDPGNGEKILGLIHKLVDNEGYTVIMATHNIDFAEKSDRILEITNGRIVQHPNK